MAYDLTPKVSPFLDRHLVFPLLEFLQDNGIHPPEEVLKAKVELLGKTNMVDYAMEIHRTLYNTDKVPQAMSDKRDEVVRKLKVLEEAAKPITDFLQDADLVKELRQDKQYNLHMLQEKFQIGPAQIDALYRYAKFQFECGNYSGAAEYLFQYRTLCTDPERSISALWGKLAAEILNQNWDVALEELNALREIIDTKSFASPLNLLQQRTWLLHWSLFVYFNTENGRNNLIDVFFSPPYMNAIQTNARHLLRYLAAAVISNKRKRNMLKDVIKVVEQEAYAFSDPVTDFLQCLFVNYDFEGAQKKLAECEGALACDFFLGQQEVDGNYTVMRFRDEFLENSRLFIFETYCRIHQCIDIRMLGEKLSMSQDAAEAWILSLIKSAKLDAKIDSKAGTVVMLLQHPGVYETIIERTKNLTARSYLLTTNVTNIAGPIGSI